METPMPPIDTDAANESPAQELLAVRCQLGEADAFDELVRRWHPPLTGFVRRLAKDDDAAQEILQEGWLRIVRGIGGLRDPKSLVSWMFRIVRWTAMDRLRETYSRGDSVPVEEELLEAGEDPSAFGEDEALLHEALEEMSVADREVLTLFYLEELSLRQVGEILEIPVGTVKSRLFRARGALAVDLEKKGLKP